MRIVLIGQAPFGREALETLLRQGEEVVGVVTIPDSPNQKYPNPVKEYALDQGIPLFQERLLKTPEAIGWVRERRPDLLVLAFVTSFVPREMIDCAPLGGINYHPSLLPKYRGGSAINWAVINGETETGVSIHYIDEGVDTGSVLLQEKVAIGPDDTVKSLYFEKLYPLGIRMIAEAVGLIRRGTVQATAQDESRASFQPVITANDTVIDWNLPTDRIYNLIRGANPSPGASTTLHGSPCKIFDARKGTGTGTPGTIIAITVDSFTVATADSAIRVEVVQPSGGKKSAAADFTRTAKLAVGDRFGD